MNVHPSSRVCVDLDGGQLTSLLRGKEINRSIYIYVSVGGFLWFSHLQENNTWHVGVTGVCDADIVRTTLAGMCSKPHLEKGCIKI